MISIWEQESFYRHTDVLIIGSGLMGLWTAYELQLGNPRLNITLADTLPVPALASTRNAGFACFGSPSELWADRESLGENAMLEIVEMRFRGIQKIRRVFGDMPIGYDACGGYEVYDAASSWTGNELADRIALLNKGLAGITGIDNMYRVCSTDLAKMGMHGFDTMVGNAIEGGLHSGKLVLALQSMLQKKGAIFLGGHKAAQVEGEAENYTVTLVSGERECQIGCKAILWATNAGLSLTPELADLVKPARGQVLLSPPIEGLQLKGTFHFDEGFYYFRNLQNRLLIGGARNKAMDNENTLTDEISGEIRGHLEQFIINHLPQAAAYIEREGWVHWAGIMGMSREKKPFITNPSPGIFCALACNGMGVALTPVLAESASDQLLNALR